MSAVLLKHNVFGIAQLTEGIIATAIIIALAIAACWLVGYIRTLYGRP